jgi:hypothetical protein
MRTTGAASPTIRSAPLAAIRAAETHLAPIFVPPAIGRGPAFARSLHSDCRLCCAGQLSLQPDAAPRRIQHLEQAFVESLGPSVASALSDELSEVARSGLDGRSLPWVHPVQLYRIAHRDGASLQQRLCVEITWSGPLFEGHLEEGLNQADS